jgi:Uma2 family endonuclease
VTSAVNWDRMSGVPAKRPATYEDLLKVPEHLVAEIIDGELITSPRPAARHTVASSALGADLGSAFGRTNRGGPGGWVILDEPELHIVGQVLVPDLAGWRRERMPEVPDVAFFDVAPDWICEVLSPSTAARDRTRKMHHYARARVAHLWFLDPVLQTLEVFRLDGDGWRLAMSAAGDAPVRAEPFDAIDLDMAGLWAR